MGGMKKQRPRLCETLCQHAASAGEKMNGKGSWQSAFFRHREERSDLPVSLLGDCFSRWLLRNDESHNVGLRSCAAAPDLQLHPTSSIRHREARSDLPVSLLGDCFSRWLLRNDEVRNVGLRSCAAAPDLQIKFEINSL